MLAHDAVEARVPSILISDVKIAILLFTFSNISQAGFNGLTLHSRANCGNNESISWDATRAWHLGTNSTHAQYGKQ